MDALTIFMIDVLLENDTAEFDDDDDDFVLFAVSSHLRRDNIPKVIGFAEKIVASYTDHDFRKDFRINKLTYVKLMDSLRPILSYEVRPSGKPGRLPEKQVQVYLWYISNQNSMREVSRLFGLSTSTTHRCVRRVSAALCDLRRKMIAWPDPEEQDAISPAVEEMCHVPNCIGFIDGTHIRLSSMPNNDQDYVNRKGYPSLQLQIVVDDRLLIRDSYVGWPGCAHDARVFRNSPISDALAQQLNISPNKFIVGDSAYPLSETLMTPFRDNGRLTADQRHYNRRISSARQAVERAIGHLKGRFRRLRNIDCGSVRNTCYLITSACMLHNLCVLSSDDISEFLMEATDDADPNNFPGIFRDAGAGAMKRNNLVQYLERFR